MGPTVGAAGSNRQWRESHLSSNSCHTSAVLRDVAVAVGNSLPPFELGVICEVFGTDRTAAGLPGFDFAVCAFDPPPLSTTSGFSLDTPHGLERLESADLIAVPGWHELDRVPPEPLLDALRRAVARRARVMSVCSGAFVLGAAGLLNGRRATTHWMYAAELAARFPAARVDPGVLYVDEGLVLTSAGTAAGVDLCLHVVRSEFGARIANAIARRMVVPAHRDGGQAQYIETPLPERRPAGDIALALDWMRSHLAERLPVERLATQLHMSERTFARRFAAATGTSPHRWVVQQRCELAQRLLEETRDPVEEVARRAGFGDAANLRGHFVRWRGTPPHEYRRAFREREG